MFAPTRTKHFPNPGHTTTGTTTRRPRLLSPLMRLPPAVFPPPNRVHAQGKESQSRQQHDPGKEAFQCATNSPSGTGTCRSFQRTRVAFQFAVRIGTRAGVGSDAAGLGIIQEADRAVFVVTIEAIVNANALHVVHFRIKRLELVGGTAHDGISVAVGTVKASLDELVAVAGDSVTLCLFVTFFHVVAIAIAVIIVLLGCAYGTNASGVLIICTVVVASTKGETSLLHGFRKGFHTCIGEEGIDIGCLGASLIPLIFEGAIEGKARVGSKT
jgi:hypothetical protein